MNKDLYIRQLEAQNEQLQQRLAEEESFRAWKDKRTSGRIHFYYVRESDVHCKGDSLGFIKRQREFVTRSQFLSMLITIKTDGIDKLFKQLYGENKVEQFSLSLYGVSDCRWSIFDYNLEVSPLRKVKVLYELR